jgi:hypothetical protein
MDTDSETFDMTFIVEQQGDGPRRLSRSIETHPDGSRIVVEYEEVLPANDPRVRSRQRTVGDDPPRAIVTEFLPSLVRPQTYPAGFPFLAGRECHTTESPAGSVSPGARWPCEDPDAVLAALVDICLGEGWLREQPSSVEPLIHENLVAAFKREDDVRLFHRVDHEGGSVMQMLDLHGSWLDDHSRGRP